MIFTLIGPPGSGKTTVGKHIANELNMPFYSCGQMLRDKASKDPVFRNIYKEYAGHGIEIPPEHTTNVIMECIANVLSVSTDSHIMIDGFPRDAYQLEAFARVYAGKYVWLYCDVTLTECLDRLEKRQREDDQVNVIRSRFHHYETTMKPFYHDVLKKPGQLSLVIHQNELIQEIVWKIKLFFTEAHLRQSE